MNSVKFGEKDSFKDWGLILKPKSRPLASPKTNYVSIEGKDGDLDLTTSLTGDVKYQNVKYTLEFTLQDKREDWETKLQEISTYLHGKKLNVVFSEDPNWYCVGRMTLNELTSNKTLGVIKIDCNFEPYKLKVEETIITEPIEEGKVITLSNSRKWVIPTLRTWSKNRLKSIVDYTWGNNGSATHEKIDDYIKVTLPTPPYASSGIYGSTDIRNEMAKLEGKECVYSFFARSDEERTIYYQFGESSLEYINLTTEWQRFSKVIPIMKNQPPTFYCGKDLSASPFYIKDIMLEVANELSEYQPYEESYADFDFEGISYSVNGTLKTPSVILKEGNSEITLTGGSGEIEISYKEGKL